MHFHEGEEHEHAMHTHTHADGHTHVHADVSAFESVDQAIALMSYMLDHNRHHAEELHELSHKLEATGKNESAKLIDAALDEYYHGNDELAKALALLKEGK